MSCIDSILDDIDIIDAEIICDALVVPVCLVREVNVLIVRRGNHTSAEVQGLYYMF